MNEPGPSVMMPRRGNWRRMLLGTIALTAALAGVVVWYAGRGAAPVEPPTIEAAGVDPAVVRAVELARKAVLRRPRSAAAWGHLGMVLRAHDFVAECKTCFAAAERLNPHEPRWPYYHGLTLLMGDPVAGIPRVRRAVELWGRVPEPRLRLAETLLAQGELDEAADHFRRVLASNPDHVRAHLGLARLAFARDDLAGSLDHCRHAIAIDGQRRSAHILLAQVLAASGKSDEAARTLTQANRLAPDRSWIDPFVTEIERLQEGLSARIARATGLLVDGHGEAAVGLLHETVQSYPGSVQAHLLLGQALLRLGQAPRAETPLHVAVQLAPDNPEAWFQLGVVQYLGGKVPEASRSFRQAIERRPDHVLAHFNLGKCLRQLGDAPAAAEELRAAVGLRAGFADAHSDLAEVLTELGAVTEAAVHRQRAAELRAASRDDQP